MLESGSVETQTSFDSHPGGPRNHDLLLVGESTGGRTIVSIESKADEAFGETLDAHLKTAQRTTDKGKNTNAPARLQGLLTAITGQVGPVEGQLLSLRSQLFSGVAGAIAAAVDNDATQAVLLIHEYVSPGVDDKRRKRNQQDLHDFCSTVFDLEIPTGADSPWCLGPLAFPGSDRLDPAVRLFIGKTTTNPWSA